MPKQIANQVKDRAVRLVLDHRDEYGSDYLARKAVAPKVGVSVESLRHWVAQARIDTGQVEGLSTSDKERLKELERENRDLREVNEILKAASIFFSGELDPRRR